MKRRKLNDPNYLPTYVETIRGTFTRARAQSTSPNRPPQQSTSALQRWWGSQTARYDRRPPPSYSQNIINDIIEHRPAWWRPEIEHESLGIGEMVQVEGGEGLTVTTPPSPTETTGAGAPSS
ncbi:hypothetical protein HDV00_003327, partial [Rhizophlyctis rosea]